MEIKHRLQLPTLMKQKGLPMIAIEVGVANGNFSRDLLTEGIELLYSIDAWTSINGQRGDGGYDQKWHDINYENALKLLSPFGQKSVILKGFSHNMAEQIQDNSVGMVHLDGDHSYEGVMRDLVSFYPKLVSGGIMSGHDFEMTHYGVKDAVLHFCKIRNIEILSIPENKPDDAGFMFYKP